MGVDFSNGSPLASALQGLVQPKLVEFGWTTGGDDTQIFEYILLMLANEKNEAQIASELSNDLLDLGPENVETQQFAHWLFEQIDLVSRQLNGQPAGAADAAHLTAAQQDGASNDTTLSAQDAEMDGVTEPAQGNIPTGPKAMRNGSGASSKPGRAGGRLLNNLNKQMSNDDPLHRVRGSQGSGRINSHSREPPKGPRGLNVGRGIAAMANGRGMGTLGSVNMGPGPGPGPGPGAMNGMNGMGMNNMGAGAMAGMPMQPMGPNGMPGMLNAQQQMALMQMYEQQAQMMQQIFSGGAPAPYVNPNFQQGNRNGHKKPLNERMDRSSRNKQGLPPSTKFTKDSHDTTMTDGPTAENGEGSAMDIEGGRPDPFTVMCKYNLRCTKTDCPFVHQSPAAPEGTPVDMKDTCTYGATCTNKKCVGRHSSPAYRYQAEQECAFYPNCRDMANCPYKHPTMPPCRNGADCTTPNCKFWHNTIMCKFAPCTNFRCPFKHVEGQKKTFKDKVWVAGKNGEEASKEHVSERKFVEDEGVEELIIPGKANEDIEI
ncbi:hypothetical protein K505DRAFT_284771 [Melanomma pulvis-pyrius CBS 109.77]|uniref:Nab2-like CCCH zinc finger domain-containing protein n=1 Tax=Melanomma pulvis-pyrius CBS 109.77 TaxID=1314802 RepID=A0A6A6WYC3_9PLEO|nr:hypothetical protein K505DRAFT_284771 [Melanomma pulvis-pyrius CBS 109.77]